jgi:two-component system, OmpR family, sensor histidine kinase TctE
VTRSARSLQRRLSIELGALFLIATVVALGGLLYRASTTADSLDNRELGLRADDLARAIVRDRDGAVRLDLPPPLVDAYGAGDQRALFAVRDSDGRVIAAAPPAFGTLVSRWKPAEDDPDFFRLGPFGAPPRDYHGLNIRLASAAGPVSVTVAELAGGDQLVEALLIDFINDVAWLVPPFLAVALLVVLWSIRRGLRPLREASARAQAISPDDLTARLSEADLPTEVRPLAAAVNRAFDRLEQAFALQRTFTANAAHELRTPLAIVTARLDAMAGHAAGGGAPAGAEDSQLAELRTDVQRMNRLVEQLMCVARLDSVALDVSQPVDLADTAAEVVGYLAPLAIAQARTIALNAPDAPVLVRGNRPAIADAVRNLVENALAYAPPATEVTVTVSRDGVLSVADRGDGIAADDRPHLFNRFWRGRQRRGGGAGLGLALVAEIVKSHQGTISVADNQPRGARFDLKFQKA